MQFMCSVNSLALNNNNNNNNNNNRLIAFLKRNSPKPKIKLNAMYITHEITDINYFNTYT